MAAGNSENFRNLITLSVHGQRFRGNDASEILVDCIAPEYKIKQKTYRVIVQHYNEKHKSHLVLGMKCNYCVWNCSESLRCFTSHMQQQHDLTVYMETILTLQAVKKPKHVNHTPICSRMRSDSVALNKKLKSDERAAARVVKKASKLAAKAKKDTPAIPEEILLIEHAEETENIVTINEEPIGGESLGDFFDGQVVQIREIESQIVNNVIAKKPEKTTATPTSRDMWTDADGIEYDDADTDCLSSDDDDFWPSSDSDDVLWK